MPAEGYTIKEIVGIRVDDCYMSLKTLSKYSDLSKTTLKKLINDPFDPIPAIEAGPGGKILVRKSTFDTWMERHRLNHSQRKEDVDRIVEEALVGLKV